MRWNEEGSLVDRHGQTRAVVRPLGGSPSRATVWEVLIPGRETVRASSEAAGRLLAERAILPPKPEPETHR